MTLLHCLPTGTRRAASQRSTGLLSRIRFRFAAVLAASAWLASASTTFSSPPAEMAADNFECNGEEALTNACGLPDLTMPVPVDQKKPDEPAKAHVGLFSPTMSETERLEAARNQLEMARHLRNKREAAQAELKLVELLADETPNSIQRSALLELAALAQDQNDLTRALQIYAQFMNRWSDDLRAPEILLRQGQLFRRQGINNLALAKFYAVMTAALVLKSDQLEYYERLVLQAQIEIAETHYQLGRHADAADFLSRLLKQKNPSLERAQILFKLVRSYSAMNRFEDAAARASEFLAEFPAAPEQPEVRFHLALALKQLNRNNESLQQVLILLEEQRSRTQGQPALWAYWQQRTGNLIANQLYREGDYPKALEVYLGLSQLDNSPAWQVPVKYQVGMTYERLLQPAKAVETYKEILVREKNLGDEATPNLKSVFDMARWRINFIQWQGKAEDVNARLRDSNSGHVEITANYTNTNLTSLP